MPRKLVPKASRAATEFNEVRRKKTTSKKVSKPKGPPQYVKDTWVTIYHNYTTRHNTEKPTPLNTAYKVMNDYFTAGK